MLRLLNVLILPTAGKKHTFFSIYNVTFMEYKRFQIMKKLKTHNEKTYNKHTTEGREREIANVEEKYIPFNFFFMEIRVGED